MCIIINIFVGIFVTTDGTHCPMALFWPINSTDFRDLNNNFVFVSNLSNQSDAQQLGLDPQTMFPGISSCPETFTWKGLFYRNYKTVCTYIIYAIATA